MCVLQKQKSNMMKSIVITLFLMACIMPVMGQDEEEEDVKVRIFTAEERNNLQLWYYEEFQRMGLSEETEARYQSILTYYAVKMARLDDKDQEWTREQFRAKLKEYLAKQESDIREILTPEQYAMHEEIYGEFLRSMYRRWGIEKD